MGLFRQPGDGTEKIKGSTHMVEGDHHLRKDPNPHPQVFENNNRDDMWGYYPWTRYTMRIKFPQRLCFMLNAENFITSQTAYHVCGKNGG